MQRMIFLTLPMLFLMSCAEDSQEGRAAAILDAADQPAQRLGESLTGEDLNAIRRDGLVLLTVLDCWPDGCIGP